MKINLSKCELIPLNISPKEGSFLVSQLGYKIGTLPITYLAVPLYWKNLTSTDWDFLVQKIENKLQEWKRKLLSVGGRVVLLNYVLSSMPLYWMSFYKMPQKVKIRIDKLRKCFL